MTVAEAEAALSAAIGAMNVAKDRLREAQRAESDAWQAVCAAERSLGYARAEAVHVQRPVPAWLQPSSATQADLRVLSVSEGAITLVSKYGRRTDHSRRTGFVRHARGHAKVEGGQLDVQATLDAHAAAGARS